MKLQELLSEIFSSGEYPKVNSRFGIVHETIYGEDLEQFKERILQTEEFSECEELIIMKHPIIAVENGKTVHNLTYKHQEGQKFKGKCYLLSLALTPEMFDPKTMHTPVLDGACITPTMYDPTTFEPKKKIVLEFSPEFSQDQYIYGLGSPSMIEEAEKNGETIIRKQLHETLDRIFDNPEMYQVKGEKGVMIRGAFEVVESPLGIEKTKLFGLGTENETHFPAFFFEKDEENSKDGEPNLKLSKMDIPINLKEKYLEEIGHKKSIFNIKREEIKEFLNTQK